MSADGDNGSAAGRPHKPCPICGRPAVQAARPFCSKRCADIDLHRWLGGHYALPITDPQAARADANADAEDDRDD